MCRDLDFKYYEIIGISIEQAETFLGRYFDDDIVKYKRLVKSIKESRILEKLPKTPLTLTLLTSLFEENGYEIPATISDLYKYFIEVLLNKNIKDSHLDLLKVGIHKSILSYIAEYLHINKLKSISKYDLAIKINEFARERGHKYSAEDLILDLVQDINILVENDRGEIEFKHLSFQEYFTAYQYYSTAVEGKVNFIKNFNDIWWQNVAIFYAGMTKDSPDLIDEILNESTPKEFYEYLINIAGFGYLIQALYNTPMRNRLKVIENNIKNINKALEFIINTNEEKYSEIKTFLHTSYGASLRYGLVEEKGNRYRLGAAYIGWGNYRIGIDSDRHVRHPIQNILAHTWLSPQPGFEVLSGGIKPFFQYQTRNKFTSW